MEFIIFVRIDCGLGMIEVLKKVVVDYIVLMFILMFLYEYGYKWKNFEYNKEIVNELMVDIIVVYIVLNLGFDFIEVENCYCVVFVKKDMELNCKCMKVISEFIYFFRVNELICCKI